jgi:cystathionine gamma-lyase
MNLENESSDSPQSRFMLVRILNSGKAGEKFRAFASLIDLIKNAYQFIFDSFRAVIPPISLATTYKQFGPEQHSQFEYSRFGNPTRNVLEACLAALDNGKYGLTFASGLGTQTAIISTLKSGEGIITGNDVNGGTNRLFRNLPENMGIEVTFVDMTDLKKLEEAIKPNVKLVWLETPTNPTMKVIDIKGVADIVHSKSEAFLVVDNTQLTPYFQRPLDFGADVVVYSLTSFMNGHSDVTMGSIVTNNEKLNDKLRYYQGSTGIVPSPFDCYMVNRSLKTLSLRMKCHFKNSVAVAKFLESHPKISKVLHPALPSHPQHKLATEQTFGHSGIMSFYIKDATLEMSTTFLQSLRVFILAGSFGGCESLAELPCKQTHMTVPEEQRKELGLEDGLIRISVGLEDSKDLIYDLDQALSKMKSS